MRKLVALALVLLAPSVALAAGKKHLNLSLGTLLDDIALNAAAGTRTFSLLNPEGGFEYATLEVIRTYNAGTDLNMLCAATNRVPATTPVAEIPDIWRTVAVESQNLIWYIKTAGWQRMDCTVSSTSANANDKLSVYGRLTMGEMPEVGVANVRAIGPWVAIDCSAAAAQSAQLQQWTEYDFQCPDDDAHWIMGDQNTDEATATDGVLSEGAIIRVTTTNTVLFLSCLSRNLTGTGCRYKERLPPQ